MIDGINNTVLDRINGNGGNPKLSQSQSDELRESFLTMLVTQLENQDPMDPMKNEEMTSQLAQINTVSGIEQLNDTLNGITQQMDAGKMLQASGLIGNAVLVPGNSVKVNIDDEGASHATPFGIELAKPAERVDISVTSKTGEVVYTEKVENVSAGVQSFSWDGLNNNGEPLVAGDYRVSLKAFDAEGEEMSAESLNYALVQGVTPAKDDGDVRLDLGAIYGQVGIDQVKQIL
ncbi:flagellar hook assembly protein FlgD [Halomonas llamarensis]|uniref:Basal-body rod modification protein FlgD n=1 Tax=Halomonas llamarensis TaxID=2945104 RepID=A0ABT0SNU6_9GAMM|nr:flagellar hook assembly protein FlgD [Halomonas llamarensis]MCL7929301.1 flagellar hook assembly protein FlgD [Halomonas llamarensis]